MSRSLLVIAGEISGDMHAARVVRSLQDQCPDIHCWGIGGDDLRATGMELLYDAKDMAVLGLTEVLKRYGFFRRVFRECVREMKLRKPDAVLLVDYPGFNLRFARVAKRHGVKVIYYICPQVWAWHRSRIQRMAQIVDRLLVIFPFEVDVFKHTQLRVDFVGHPLVAAAQAALAEPPISLPWPDLCQQRVALLPGSRKQEVERILPTMLDAVHHIAQKRNSAGFLIAAPSAQVASYINEVLAQHPRSDTITAVVIDQTRHVLRQAHAAIVASGTATLETALLGCPMIVVYKTAALTYFVGKRLIQVPYLGMVNLVAKRHLCPEFLQNDAQPERMAAAMLPLLEDSTERATMLAGLQEVARELGDVDAAEAAAAVIRSELTA